MKKSVKRICLALVIGFGLVEGGLWLLIPTLGTRESLYQGKPAGFWVTQVNSHDTGLSNAGNAVLNGVIIPQLSATLLSDTNDSSFKLALVDMLNELPGVSIRLITAPNRRKGAAFTLGTFGPAAKAAVPALIQALNGPDHAVRPMVAGALGKIRGQPDVVVPLLIKYLDDDGLDEAAAVGLGDFGTLAKAAVPKLAQLAKNPHNPGLQTLAGRALKQIDPQAAADAGVK